jgi:pimeloyl-ACP methyl ester carboxylesterase
MPTLRANGIEIAYTLYPAAGGAGSETPLVIVHGLAASQDDWGEFIAEARQRGPVLFYDLRGHGGSSPGDTPGQTTLTDLTADLTGLLDALGIERAHVLGHSLGGMIALDCVLRDPGRIHGLVLESTTPQAPTPDERRAFLRLLSPVALPGTDVSVEGMLEQHGAVQTAPSAAAYALITRPDQTPHLEGIRAPTLVIAGETDGPLVQQGAELLHGWIPTSRLVRIEGGGHHAHREQPQAFTELILGFLREIDSAGQ